jgi:PAS domain S-box-containing protein
MNTEEPAIYLLDPSGRILGCNAEPTSTQADIAPDVIGKSFSVFYSLDDVKNGKPIRDLRAAEVQGIFKEEVNRVRKDGTVFQANVTISAIHDEKKNLKCFVKTVQNISRRSSNDVNPFETKDLFEARIKERTQDLLRSNAELEQFAYIASHDLQTPLRHVSSYVQLLTSKIRKTGNLDAKSEKWIGYILTGTQQMKSLISDLLTYSRIGRVDIRVEEIDLVNLLENVKDSLRETIHASNAQLIYDELPIIFGVQSQIDQLFQNLIENALKFKKSDTLPVVTIGTEDQGEFWRFSVSDNGIGIDPKYSERIFMMFQRLHSSDEYKGTGIGLAICKKIVESHGGKIGVKSDLDQGATFYFTLPKIEKVTSAGLAGENGRSA